MPEQVRDAEFDLLTLSDLAQPCDFASGPKGPTKAAPNLKEGTPAWESLFPIKVLIVEDEALVALDICNFLSGAGYEVVGLVATEQDAVRKAIELQPDLVIMDLKLKDGGDGFRASRKINSGQNVPILYITAYRNRETLERLDEQPSSDILFKPFARKPLLEAVETTVKRHRN
ncbi:MAG: response regulator [Alphaproteobacteria bacterium]|nr:response regulator [Alphaproteobacteria bacterium]